MTALTRVSAEDFTDDDIWNSVISLGGDITLGELFERAGVDREWFDKQQQRHRQLSCRVNGLDYSFYYAALVLFLSGYTREEMAVELAPFLENKKMDNVKYIYHYTKKYRFYEIRESLFRERIKNLILQYSRSALSENLKILERQIHLSSVLSDKLAQVVENSDDIDTLEKASRSLSLIHRSTEPLIQGLRGAVDAEDRSIEDLVDVAMQRSRKPAKQKTEG